MADLTRYHRERYFDPELEEWDGPFPLRCAAVVADDAQCSRKRGHGPEGAFCKQHAKRHAETKAAIDGAAERHGDALRRLAQR